MASSDNRPHSRRDFIKAGSLGVLGAFVATSLTGRNKAQAEGAKLVPVDPKDPMAQSLGYTADAKKVDLKKYPKRAGAAGAKMFCYNCQFYGIKKDGKASKEAACTIFAGKAVNSHAWCNSWTQDPSVKD